MSKELSDKITELVKMYNEFRILKKECEDLLEKEKTNKQKQPRVKDNE